MAAIRRRYPKGRPSTVFYHFLPRQAITKAIKTGERRVVVHVILSEAKNLRSTLQVLAGERDPSLHSG